GNKGSHKGKTRKLRKEVLFFNIKAPLSNVLCYHHPAVLPQKIPQGRGQRPWLHTREGLSVDEHSDRIITKELIGEYFVVVKKKFSMLTPGDIKGYTKAAFEQIN